MNAEPEIPKFLLRASPQFGKTKVKAKRKSAAIVAPDPAPQSQLPKLPEGLRWAANQAEEDGFFTTKGIVPVRWAGEPDTIDYIARDLRLRQQRKAASLETFKAVMAERRAAAPPKLKRPAFGTGLFIIAVTGERKAGTAAAARFEAMKQFMAANKKASVADMMAATDYRIDDYHWDFTRGNIKVNTNTSTQKDK